MFSYDPDLIVVDDVSVINETLKALFCKHGLIEFWMPKSQIRYGTTVEKIGDTGTLVLPRWLANKVGLAVSDEWSINFDSTIFKI